MKVGASPPNFSYSRALASLYAHPLIPAPMNFINVPQFDEMSVIKRHFIKLGHSDNLDNRHLVKLGHSDNVIKCGALP